MNDRWIRAVIGTVTIGIFAPPLVSALLAMASCLGHRPSPRNAVSARRRANEHGGQGMTQTLGFVCCVVLLAFQSMQAIAGQTPASESKPVTLTATIEAIDKTSRTVILKGPKGNGVLVKAPEDMEGFNSLKIGDLVTATYFEAIAVQVHRPGDPEASGIPTTTTQRKDRTPGSQTRREQTFTVTVVSVDPKASSLTVKDSQGRVVPLKVHDAKRLQNVKAGDTVDVTYYESLLIKVTRPPK